MQVSQSFACLRLHVSYTTRITCVKMLDTYSLFCWRILDMCQLPPTSCKRPWPNSIQSWAWFGILCRHPSTKIRLRWLMLRYQRYSTFRQRLQSYRARKHFCYWPLHKNCSISPLVSRFSIVHWRMKQVSIPNIFSTIMWCMVLSTSQSDYEMNVWLKPANHLIQWK